MSKKISTVKSSLKPGSTRLEDVINDLITKHNILAARCNTFFKHAEVSFDDSRQKEQQLVDQNSRLITQNKSLAFYLNDIRITVETLIKVLEESEVDLDTLPEAINKALSINLGVNAEYIPVGNCIVSHYNLEGSSSNSNEDCINQS